MKISDFPFSEFCEPQSGDCGTVAVAIGELLESKPQYKTYFVTTRDIPKFPYHVTVIIDGEMYDSTGKVTHQEMIQQTASAINRPSIRDETAYGLAERNCRTLDTETIKYSDAFSKEKFQDVKKELEKSLL